MESTFYEGSDVRKRPCGGRINGKEESHRGMQRGKRWFRRMIQVNAEGTNWVIRKAQVNAKGKKWDRRKAQVYAEGKSGLEERHRCIQRELIGLEERKLVGRKAQVHGVCREN